MSTEADALLAASPSTSSAPTAASGTAALVIATSSGVAPASSQANAASAVTPTFRRRGGYEEFHVIGDFGGQFPVDTDAQSTSILYHLHLDYSLRRHRVPFFEVGGFHDLDRGARRGEQEPSP